jgi:hypothetical protein
MHWIIQENLYNEIGFNSLINALVALNVPHSVHKIIPFIHELVPEINPSGRVMVMGAYTMNKIAIDRGWTPGTYLNDQFDYELQCKKWSGHMLNEDAHFFSFKDASLDAQDDEYFFIRPVEDMKCFAGQVMSYIEFKDWQHGVLGLELDDGYPLHGDTEILMSPVKKIYTETRVWVVNIPCKFRSVVTASTYRVGKCLNYTMAVDSDILQFVEERNTQWRPDEAYVMDVARTPDGLKIVEVNNINASGFYGGDVSKIVAALEELNGTIE